MLTDTMRITQLRQADLNLLVVFTVLAEERNVSLAAKRLSLSQPALTCALQRIRQMFREDLIIRVSGNYEPTPIGRSLLQGTGDNGSKTGQTSCRGRFRPGGGGNQVPADHQS
jgi:hypothetical protein